MDENDPNLDLINLEGAQVKGMSIKLLVVEDHPFVRLGLRMLMESASDMEIVGEAGTAEGAIRFADSLEPNVVLMDIGLPDGSGIEATVEIKKRHPEMTVVALTIHEDNEYIDKMLLAGANGYVSKRTAPEQLVKTIRKAAQGQVIPHPVAMTQDECSLALQPMGENVGRELHRLLKRTTATHVF
jgi:two-component system response regulator NreC